MRKAGFPFSCILTDSRTSYSLFVHLVPPEKISTACSALSTNQWTYTFKWVILYAELMKNKCKCRSFCWKFLALPAFFKSRGCLITAGSSGWIVSLPRSGDAIQFVLAWSMCFHSHRPRLIQHSLSKMFPNSWFWKKQLGPIGPTSHYRESP